jgi:hypothetical protein
MSVYKTACLAATDDCSLDYEVSEFLRAISADDSGLAVKGMKCLRPPKHWDCGFDSQWIHVCVCGALYG